MAEIVFKSDSGHEFTANTASDNPGEVLAGYHLEQIIEGQKDCREFDGEVFRAYMGDTLINTFELEIQYVPEVWAIKIGEERQKELGK